ncbi:MAG: GntR family transcriptional regulator [Rhodobacteraceae bacterium]|nr:GntR family transcriptional regulator [Paracoccaceae bacterium]
MLAVVRRQIINGEKKPGEKINEAAVAIELGVSRTPARTALASLAAEGLIEKRDGRGFTVSQVSAADVVKAVEVRAALESLAAGSMAENGMNEDVERILLDVTNATQELLDTDDPSQDLIGGYSDQNKVFHETIMRDCGNHLISHAFERIAMLPMAGLGTLVFDASNFKRERMRLTVGHSQHVILFDAFKQRDRLRAEAIMREHSKATLNYADLFVRKKYRRPDPDVTGDTAK